MLCPASMNISGMVWYEVRLIAFLSSALHYSIRYIRASDISRGRGATNFK